MADWAYCREANGLPSNTLRTIIFNARSAVAASNPAVRITYKTGLIGQGFATINQALLCFMWPPVQRLWDYWDFCVAVQRRGLEDHWRPMCCNIILLHIGLVLGWSISSHINRWHVWMTIGYLFNFRINSCDNCLMIHQHMRKWVKWDNG